MPELDLNWAVSCVRQKKPLIQCITNFVTVNDCANIILAVGGSPSMADHINEAADAVEHANALVCNMGAMDCIDSMISAGQRAGQLGIPSVLDPVAAGGTRFRREESARLLEKVHFSVIRGNASEIRFLAGQQTTGSGVDASTLDAVTEENLALSIDMAQNLSRKTGSVIVISGVIDVIANGIRYAVIRNGCSTMARITGSGCMLTAMTGAFCGALPHDPFIAACAAVAVMDLSGEAAERRRLQNGTGNATFRNDLIDAVFNFTDSLSTEGLSCEIYQ